MHRREGERFDVPSIMGAGIAAHFPCLVAGPTGQMAPNFPILE
jgi:hypothetical protein